MCGSYGVLRNSIYMFFYGKFESKAESMELNPMSIRIGYGRAEDIMCGIDLENTRIKGGRVRMPGVHNGI